MLGPPDRVAERAGPVPPRVPGERLGDLEAVHAALAAGLLFTAHSPGIWALQLALGTAIALPAVLAWLIASCMLKQPLARLPAPAQAALTAALGAACALAGWALALQASPLGLEQLSPLATAVAGAGLALVMHQWLRMQALARGLDAVPAVPLQLPPGSHQLYLEVNFDANEETQIKTGHLNGISHLHNMDGGMMPTLFDKAVYGTPSGTASAEPANEFHNSARKPFGYADSGAPLPLLPIAYSDDSHYLLPPGAVVIMLINNTDSGEHPFVRTDGERLRRSLRRSAITSPADCVKLTYSGSICWTTASGVASPWPTSAPSVTSERPMRPEIGAVTLA